jgi:hypothetical protein
VALSVEQRQPQQAPGRARAVAVAAARVARVQLAAAQSWQAAQALLPQVRVVPLAAARKT